MVYPERMAGEDCRVSMEIKESAVSSDRWPNQADAGLTDFQDYQVEMVDQDSTESQDAMVKTTPGQVDLVTMDCREPQDCQERLETVD